VRWPPGICSDRAMLRYLQVLRGRQ
jgi:hypothetical protein